MFITNNSKELDLSVKYGEFGKSLFNVVTKYCDVELTTPSEKEIFMEELKSIISNDLIDFNDKLLIISSTINATQNIKSILF